MNLTGTSSTDARTPRSDGGYWFMNTGEENGKPQRQWEDSHKYGFLLAGGGTPWIAKVLKLMPGDRVFAYLTGRGYVGYGLVTAAAVPLNVFVPRKQAKRLPELRLHSKLDTERLSIPEKTDWCVAVEWVKALPREDAVLIRHARRGTLCRIRQVTAVRDLLKVFNPADPST